MINALRRVSAFSVSTMVILLAAATAAWAVIRRVASFTSDCRPARGAALLAATSRRRLGRTRDPTLTNHLRDPASIITLEPSLCH